MGKIVNNIVLSTSNLLRVDLKYSHHKQRMLTLWGDWCVD